MTEKRRRRLWGAFVVCGLVALGAIGVARVRPSFLARSAKLTPSSPEVDALRAAVKDANVLIVVLDAMRADHVGCYGYPRDTTPNLDRTARSSVQFDWHFSQSSETKSSTACLLTSQYCDTNLADGPRRLLPGTFTMEKGLERAGLRTLLISSNLKATPLYGLGDDFQEVVADKEFDPLLKEGGKRYSPTVALRAFAGWLDSHSKERFFAYVHFAPPHYPYEQPEEFTKLFRGLEPVDFEPGGVPFPERIPKPFPTPPALPEWINLYDANLRYGDWAVGEAEKLLSERGLLEKTLVIITADHGEAFGEHAHPWHGRSVYDEACHIPLLMRFPNGLGARRRIEALTQTIDLLPTIFDLLAVKRPGKGMQGKSLAPLLAGAADPVREYVFCRGGGSPSKYLVRSKEQALILYSNGEWRARYDLKKDPKQRRNVIGENAAVAEEMVEAFRRFAEEQRRPPRDFLEPGVKMPPLPEAPELKLSPEDRARVERIADLGYVR